MPTRVSLHFVAKRGRAAELAQLLHARGFVHVHILPGERRVLLTATAHELHHGLGLSMESVERSLSVGPRRHRRRVPALPAAAMLPDDIATLVDRCYVPTPPDRLRADPSPPQ